MTKQWSSDELALLAAIHADPRSDLPRLVYADWLDENGQPEYAEFIRLQCRSSSSQAAETRAKELLVTHRGDWSKPIPRGFTLTRFARGLPVLSVEFPRSLHTRVSTVLAAWTRMLSSLPPQPRIKFWFRTGSEQVPFEPNDLRRYLAHPIFTRADELIMHGGDLWSVGLEYVQVVAESPLPDRAHVSFECIYSSEQARALWCDSVKPRMPKWVP